MNKIIKIYDPVTLNKYTFNLNELRVWLDILSLQNIMERNNQYKNSFNRLDSVHKESFLNFLDRHEDKKSFLINKWRGIPGIKLTFNLDISYNPEAKIFTDKNNQIIKDNFFYNKKIYTMASETSIKIKRESFPIKLIWGINDDFHVSQPLNVDEEIPLFNKYMGNETNNDTKILLNHDGYISPVSFTEVIHTENNWIFTLTLTIESSLEWNNLIIPHIPKMRKLYEFFNNNGYKPLGDGIKRVLWKKDGSVIEYNITPITYYSPFILIKANKGNTDVPSRTILGKEILNKLKDEGIIEEILFYRASLTSANALDKLSIKNKMPSDKLLSEAISLYDQCEQHLQYEAKAEAIFLAWIKNRISKHYNDKEIYYNSISNISERFSELRTWQELSWFLLKIFNKEDQNIPFEIIREIMPLNTLDKEFFISQKAYKDLLSLWDKAQKVEKKPTDIPKSEWHYNTALQAFNIGLKKVAEKRLNLFYKETEKRPEEIKWITDTNEELLELSIKTNTQKRYLKFAQFMSTYFAKKRKGQGIGDMSAVGRKNYRWLSFAWSMTESRLAFHSGFLLSKEDKQNKKDINKWYKMSLDALSEGLLYYDVSENYNLEQLELISHAFVTAHHLSVSIKDYDMMNYIHDTVNDFWKNHYSLEVYNIIHGIFSKEERESMADFLIEEWMEDIKNKEGEFKLDINKSLNLIDIYLSVEEWEEAGKTLNYALEKFTWNYTDLNKAYDIFKSLESFNNNAADISRNQIYYWINFYQKETEKALQYIPNTISKIKKIEQI